MNCKILPLNLYLQKFKICGLLYIYVKIFYIQLITNKNTTHYKNMLNIAFMSSQYLNLFKKYVILQEL